MSNYCLTYALAFKIWLNKYNTHNMTTTETDKMRHYNDYIYASREATSAKGLANNRQVAQFHYFNPNGLEKRRIKNNDRISELIKAGVVKSGMSLAYGWLSSDYYTDCLRDLALKKRVNSRKLKVILELLEKQVETQEQKIAEAIA